jgi:hypothetical protein
VREAEGHVQTLAIYLSVPTSPHGVTTQIIIIVISCPIIICNAQMSVHVLVTKYTTRLIIFRKLGAKIWAVVS